MAIVPETTSDTGIHSLIDEELWPGGKTLPTEIPMTTDEKMDRLFSGELKCAEAVQAAMNRIDRLMHQRQNARLFDLHYEYTSFAPVDQRWSCVDLSTYDGAPDAEAPCTFIGRGASEKEARMALLDQFSAFDGEEPRPRPPSRTVFSSPFEPPEVVDDRHIDFDDGLTDDDAR